MKRTPKKENRKRIVDKKWEEIFEDKNVLEKIERNEEFIITSTEIKDYYEARLVTKFDSWKSLPYIFQKNKLNILPIERGTYIISHFDAYKPLEINENIEPTKVEFPHWIKTLDRNNLSSEAKALNCAFSSGIVDIVMESSEYAVPTISGRMSSSTWNFKIQSSINDNNFYSIKNDKSQCQIDGGYENVNKFCIIEAKNSLSDDFIVRQLYYPYRLFFEQINKEIEPIFMVYSNGIFHFLIYRFLNPYNYSSIELVEQKSYKIAEKSIELKDIYKIMEEVEREGFISEPRGIPFPQADSFDRVVDLMEAIYEKPKTPEDISIKYDFDYRQGQYYSRAGMYLGLLKNDNGKIKITEIGENILQKNKRERYLAITKKILKHKVFYEALKMYLDKTAPPSKNEIYRKVMDKNKENLYKTGGGILSMRTLKRRSGTVKCWIEWILDLSRIV